MCSSVSRESGVIMNYHDVVQAALFQLFLRFFLQSGPLNYITRSKGYTRIVLVFILLLVAYFLIVPRNSETFDVVENADAPHHEDARPVESEESPASVKKEKEEEKKKENDLDDIEKEQEQTLAGVNSENALLKVASAQTDQINSAFKTRKVKVLASHIDYTKPHKPAFVRKSWQLVKDKDGVTTETYLYSAFYDDRKSIEHPAVRVIAILESSPREYFCLLWSKHGATPIVVLAERIKASSWYLRHGKRFQSEILSCGVPSVIDLPQNVSIVPDLKTQPTTSLRVQLPERPASPIDFGVCLSISYGLIPPAQIIEWMELLKQWGVGEVNVYNNSLAEESGVIMNFYVNEGFLAFRQAPSVMDDPGEETILLNMSPVLNDCLYRNMYRYRVIISTDIDELITPKKDSNYYEMMASIAKRQPSKHPATAYMFRNAYFFLELPPAPGPEYLTTQRFTYRVKHDKFGSAGKSITSPQSCVVLQNHLCWKVVPKYDTPGWLIDVDTSLGLNHHYKYCHLDDFYKKEGMCNNVTSVIYRDEGMLKFADTLIERATETMFKLNLEDVMMGTDTGDSDNPPAPKEYLPTA